MKRDEIAPDADRAAAAEAALELIERSRAFAGSARHRRLLRHLVMRTLQGRERELKETVIAVEVFGRAVDSFDPKRDSIVRVDARRLRARLMRYDAEEGRGSALRIELPVGSYVPLIAPRIPARAHAAATRRARDLAERGEHFLRQANTRVNLEAAIDRFDAALRESPHFAPACVGLARAWFNMACGWHGDARPAGEHAVEALRRALELEPENATAWALLGAMQYQLEQNWPAAQRSLRRAIALAPEQAFTHTAYGWQLMARGRFDDAERELTRARELDPQYVNSRLHMVNLRIGQGRLDDAEREADALDDLAPGSLAVVGARVTIALVRGRPDEALRWHERAAGGAPGHPGLVVLHAAALAAAGRDADADAMFDQVRRAHADHLSPYLLAVFATRRGRHDDAFAALERGLDEHDPQIVLFAVDPSFEVLHGAPRWARLLGRLGLAGSTTSSA